MAVRAGRGRRRPCCGVAAGATGPTSGLRASDRQRPAAAVTGRKRRVTAPAPPSPSAAHGQRGGDLQPAAPRPSPVRQMRHPGAARCPPAASGGSERHRRAQCPNQSSRTGTAQTDGSDSDSWTQIRHRGCTDGARPDTDGARPDTEDVQTAPDPTQRTTDPTQTASDPTQDVQTTPDPAQDVQTAPDPTQRT